MSTTVPRESSRFSIASRTRNARFPASDSELVDRVHYCYDPEDVAQALQKTIDLGLRPTVRSSGHCYEDFIVNNPNGAILDVSLLNRVTSGPEGTHPYRIEPGTMLGHAYEELYKIGGVTIPGGTCYTVAAGGHISGGGYGTLTRLYGLTVDWLTAVDILTVDRHGKVVSRQVSKQRDPDLFRALRGAQGSNFGVITAFHFAELPPIPQEVVLADISWDWKDMTEDKFVSILQTYGRWHEENSDKKETWGFFAFLHLTNKDSGRFGIGLQYVVPEGPVKDVSVVTDFLDKFQHCKPAVDDPSQGRPVLLPQERGGRQPVIVGDTVCYGEHPLRHMSWLEATVGGQGGSSIAVADRSRAKYKSSYMKKNFTDAEARAYYRMLSSDATRGLVISVDSYGGATNNLDRVQDTAIPQRSSVMKLQYMSFWKQQADDEYRLKGIRDTFTAAYSTDNVDQAYKGTPFHNDYYEGCYINYPDVDMLQHEYWPQLYYGTGDLYPFLQRVKKEYDPHNIFHHTMSIRA